MVVRGVGTLAATEHNIPISRRSLPVEGKGLGWIESAGLRPELANDLFNYEGGKLAKMGAGLGANYGQ